MKTTRCGYFETDIKDVIYSRTLPESQTSTGYRCTEIIASLLRLHISSKSGVYQVRKEPVRNHFKGNSVILR